MLMAGFLFLFTLPLVTAAWGSNLNSGLTQYLKLNESSGTTAFNSVDTTYWNGTANSASWVTGKIGNGYKVITTETISLNRNNLKGNWSFGLWVNMSSTSQGNIVWLDSGIRLTTGWLDVQCPFAGRFCYTSLNGATWDASSDSVPFNINQWYYLTVTHNDTSQALYVDGTMVASMVAIDTPTDGILNIGKDDVAGVYDEFGYWNRTLTPTEVSTLYNSGTGITYTTNFFSMSAVNSIPANNSILSNNSVTFGCNATGEGGNNITSIILNASIGATSWQQTNGSLNTDSFNATFLNNTLADGIYNWNCLVYGDNANTTTNFWRFTIDTVNPIFNIVYPANTTYNTNVSQLNFSLTHPTGTMDSCWYSIDAGATNVSTNCSLNISFLTSNEGSNTWCIYGNDTANNKGSNCKTFYKDTVNPTINFTSPTIASSTNYSKRTIPINVSVTDTNFANITINLYNSDHTLNSSNTSTSSTYFINYTGMALGTYYYNATARDTAGNINSTETRNITLTSYVINSVTYNSTTYETASEPFQLNISADGLATTSAVLVYNGTRYTATKSGNNAESLFIKTLDIATISAAMNKSFYWELSYGGTLGNSSTYKQEINPITFAICNVTTNVTYLNYTFKYEDTDAVSNGSITSSFVYYLGSGAVNKTYSYQNTTDQFSYGFCFTPNTTTVYVTPSIQYYNYESTIKTYNYPAAVPLSSSVTNTVLYLTKTANGIYSSYQVVTQSLSIIQGALVQFTLNGNVIESKLTDGSGIATFFLNPNTAYTLTASKSGYTSYSTTIYPTQSTYTITLSSISVSNVTSFNNGINYSIQPTNTYLTNRTTYNFNVTLASSSLTVSSWGFYLQNGTTILDTTLGTGGTGNLGTIGSNFDTGNYSSITLVAFWTVNGTTTNVSKIYIIETMEGSGWSIYNSIVDLKSYIASGFFGLTPIGLNIIIFVIIFVTTGVVAYKFGLTAPVAISLVMFILVLLFDVVLGLIFYDSTIFFNRIPHIATVLIGVITLGLAIKEGASY